MSTEKTQEVDALTLATTVAKAVAKEVSESTAKAVIEAERKIRVIESGPDRTSVYNPTGKAVRPKLTRTTIFCGQPQRERFLKDEEIELFNQIKAGRYNDRKWEVIESQASQDEKVVEVRIQVKEVQDRIELAMTAPTLVAILKLIIAEQSNRPAPESN